MIARAGGTYRTARFFCAAVLLSFSLVPAAAEDLPPASYDALDADSFGAGEDYAFGFTDADAVADTDYGWLEEHGFSFEGRYEIGLAGEGAFSAANTVPHAGVDMRVGWGTELDNGLKLNFNLNFGIEHSVDGWVLRSGDD